MKIRGVIFDMDGTITAPYLDFAGLKTAAKIGEVDVIEYLRGVTGKEYDRIYSLLMQFEEDGAVNAELNQGAQTLLQFLHRRGTPTGLLTRNSRKSVDVVCRKLKLKFDIVVTREDGPHKPAPEPILQMAKQWGLPPAEVLMVGDYKWDVLCAKNAGARSVVLINPDKDVGAGSNGLPEWAWEADFVVRDLGDVKDILQRGDL